MEARPGNTATGAVLAAEVATARSTAELRAAFKKSFRETLGVNPTHQAFASFLFESMAASGGAMTAALPHHVAPRRVRRAVAKAAALKVPVETRRLKTPAEQRDAYEEACANSPLLDDKHKAAAIAALRTNDGNADPYEALMKARLVVADGLRAHVDAIYDAMQGHLDAARVALAKRLADDALAYMHHNGPVVTAMRDESGALTLSLDTAALATVTVEDAKSQLITHALTSSAADRLRARFVPSATPLDFEHAAWRLLHRYAVLYGGDKRGYNWHMGTNAQAFACLREDCGVQTECFASPLNAQPLNAYFSCYEDTDAAFGSLGSFFSAQLDGGSFEVGPPYDEGLIAMLADRLLDALHRADASGTALTFVLVLPHWPTTAGIARMLASPHRTAEVVLPKNEHRYVSGASHVPTKSGSSPAFALCECDTLLLWLMSRSAPRLPPGSVERQALAWRV